MSCESVSLSKHGSRVASAAVAEDDGLTLTAGSDADVTSLSSPVKAATDRQPVRVQIFSAAAFWQRRRRSRMMPFQYFSNWISTVFLIRQSEADDCAATVRARSKTNAAIASAATTTHDTVVVVVVDC